MKRLLTSQRTIKSFLHTSSDSTIEPDLVLVFDFEPEDWMVSIDGREVHEDNIGRKLRQPAGPTGRVDITILEKMWEDRTLVKEYTEEFPVSMVQVYMAEVMKMEESINKVEGIVTEYIEEQGARVEDTYTVEV